MFIVNVMDIVWWFIVLVCGLDGMYVLGILEMVDFVFKYYLDCMIMFEFFV